MWSNAEWVNGDVGGGGVIVSVFSNLLSKGCNIVTIITERCKLHVLPSYTKT